MTRNVGLICSVENAERFAVNLKKYGYSIQALWTPDLELSLQLAATCEIPFTANEPDEVVLRKDVEMLIVNCRPSLRCHVALSALGIGKHVLCASPPGLGTTELTGLLEASNYYPQLLAIVGYHGRLPDVYQKMKRIVKQGSLGWPLVCDLSLKCKPVYTVDRYDWTWERVEGGGVLNMVGSHVIDLVSYVLDKRATTVYGLTCNLRVASPIENGDSFAHRSKSRAEDFVSFLMKFGDNASATITLNATPYAYIKLDQESIFEQTFVIYGPHGSIRTLNHDQLQVTSKQGGKISVKSIDLKVDEQEKISVPQNQKWGPYEDALLATCLRLRNQYDKPNLERFANFQDASYVGAVIDSVIRSNSGGGWSRVEYELKNDDEDLSVV